jgi:hypothetical protein
VLVASFCALLGSCSGEDHPQFFGPESSGGANGSDAGIDIDGLSGGNGANGDGNGESCAGDTIEAELLPLDMFLMVDTSGSMLSETQSGATKWNAVHDALESFFEDPRSDGIGVSLSYFPIQKPDTPETCTTNNACGDSGPCFLKLCSGFPEFPVACSSNADCHEYGPCEAFGTCANDGSLACLPIGSQCGSGLGACGPLTSYCLGTAVCDADAYSSAVVPFGVLPDTAVALTQSLDAHTPDGFTPTEFALSGALEQARTHASTEPNHKTIVLLATDGFPEGCTTDRLAPLGELLAPVMSAADAGLTGSPAVETFVIGVFNPDSREVAQVALDAIADSGGTDAAFIIDTSSDVTTEFLAALAQIRGAALACEYEIPDSSGGALDYDRVNIVYRPEDGEEQPLYYVESAGDCDPDDGGWHYDVAPSDGEPTKIQVCPQNCELFQSGEGAVEFEIGCKTRYAPIK